MEQMNRFYILITLCGCAFTNQNVHDPVVHEPTDTLKCDDACMHLRSLSCEEGDPLPDGTSCEKFCEETQNRGHALAPSCVIHIDSCDDMDNLDSFCPKS